RLRRRSTALLPPRLPTGQRRTRPRVVRTWVSRQRQRWPPPGFEGNRALVALVSLYNVALHGLRGIASAPLAARNGARACVSEKSTLGGSAVVVVAGERS